MSQCMWSQLPVDVKSEDTFGADSKEMSATLELEGRTPVAGRRSPWLTAQLPVFSDGVSGMSEEMAMLRSELSETFTDFRRLLNEIQQQNHHQTQSLLKQETAVQHLLDCSLGTGCWQPSSALTEGSTPQKYGNEKASTQNFSNSEKSGGEDSDAEAGSKLEMTPVVDASPNSRVDRSTPSRRFSRMEEALSMNGTQSRASQSRQTEAVKEQEHKALFVTMRADKASLEKEEYDVTVYYKTEGCVQAVARSDRFGNITLFVIAMNAVYIGIDADRNPADSIAASPIPFVICENLFCLFFFAEWCLRFLSFESKLDCMKDMWFKFDSGLAAMMVTETWLIPLVISDSSGTGVPTGVLKLLRLLRLARMTRLLREFPELVAMLKGVKAASRAVGSALMMLIVLTYLFSIVMHLVLNYDSEGGNDVSLGVVMWTLLVDGVFLDSIGKLSREWIQENRWIALVLLMVFILASAMTVMNMLIGVLCEVVSSVAAKDKEDAAIKLIKDTLLVILKRLDQDESGMISKDEVSGVLHDDHVVDVLRSLGIDENNFLDLLDMHYSQKYELPIQDIMNLILMLRGDRAPTVKDIVDNGSFTRYKIWQLSMDLEQMNQKLCDLMWQIKPLGPRNSVARTTITPANVSLRELAAITEAGARARGASFQRPPLFRSSISNHVPTVANDTSCDEACEQPTWSVYEETQHDVWLPPNPSPANGCCTGGGPVHDPAQQDLRCRAMKDRPAPGQKMSL